MGSVDCTVAGLVESLGGCQRHGYIVAMLLGGSPSGALGYLAGVIKQGGAVLVVLVGVVQTWG